MDEFDVVLKRLADTPTIIAAIVKAGAPPRGEEWGALEVASHLAAADRRYMERFMAAVQEREVANLGGPGGLGVRGEAAVADFRASRRAMIDYLSSLTPQQLQARVPHPRLAERSVAEFAAHLILHDVEHLGQAARAAGVDD